MNAKMEAVIKFIEETAALVNAIFNQYKKINFLLKAKQTICSGE